MDAKSKERLTQVHPRLAEKIGVIIGDFARKGVQVRVVQALRTFPEQEMLFQQGRSRKLSRWASPRHLKTCLFAGQCPTAKPSNKQPVVHFPARWGSTQRASRRLYSTQEILVREVLVKSRMRRVVKEFQILYAVVVSNLVNVMNVLVGTQRATDMGFHDQAVFPHVAGAVCLGVTGLVNKDIAIPVSAATAIPEMTCRPGASLPFAFFRTKEAARAAVLLLAEITNTTVFNRHNALYHKGNERWI